MNDLLIVTTVVVVALAAHAALYAWIRFRMHEGVIRHYLEGVGVDRDTSATAIAAATGLAEKRVRQVCRKSSQIESSGGDAWTVRDRVT